MTLRFLATGETFQPLIFQFRISDRAISYIAKEVCNAIVKYLVPLYLKVPSTEEEWLSIAEKFETGWQYPNSGFSYRQKMGPLCTLPNIFETLHGGTYRCTLSKNKETQDGYDPWPNLQTRL